MHRIVLYLVLVVGYTVLSPSVAQAQLSDDLQAEWYTDYKRAPFLAGALALGLPAGGHWYNGQVDKGLWVVLAEVGATTVIMYTYPRIAGTALDPFTEPLGAETN